jgi:hypothetical protein
VSYGTVALALDAVIEWLTARILEMRLVDAAAPSGRASRPDHAERVMTTHLAVADAAGTDGRDAPREGRLNGTVDSLGPPGS